MGHLGEEMDINVLFLFSFETWCLEVTFTNE